MAACILMGSGALQIARPAAFAESDGEIAAVSSQVSAGYSRVKLADGSFQAETYTFGEGGRLAGPVSYTHLDVYKRQRPGR